jgi:hypothetical protein
MFSSTYDIFHLAKIATFRKYALKKAFKIAKNRTENVQNRQKSHQKRSKSSTSRSFFMSTIKFGTAVACEARHRLGCLIAKDLPNSFWERRHFPLPPPSKIISFSCVFDTMSYCHGRHKASLKEKSSCIRIAPSCPYYPLSC